MLLKKGFARIWWPMRSQAAHTASAALRSFCKGQWLRIGKTLAQREG